MKIAISFYQNEREGRMVKIDRGDRVRYWHNPTLSSLGRLRQFIADRELNVVPWVTRPAWTAFYNREGES